MLMMTDYYVLSYSAASLKLLEEKHFEIFMTLHQMTHFRCIWG